MITKRQRHHIKHNKLDQYKYEMVSEFKLTLIIMIISCIMIFILFAMRIYL